MHTATVTATDPEGDTATDHVTVTVTARRPTPRRRSSRRAPTAPPVPAPLEVWFQAVADDPEGGTLTYRWDFGDGGSALGAEADHTYLQPGTFTATLTVTDRGGMSDSETIDHHRHRPAGQPRAEVEAAALPASGQAPLDVMFSAAGSDPDGDALSYAWDFGDGSPVAKGRRARHTYTRTGTYTAKVTATDRRARRPAPP